MIRIDLEDSPIAEAIGSVRRAEMSVRRLIEIISRQQETQRTLLDWLRVEYAIEKPSNKLLAATDLDSDTWVAEVNRIRGMKLPLAAASDFCFLLSQFQLSARPPTPSPPKP